MKAALALMARAPVAGQAKTRLAGALGSAGAAALAECMLRHAVAQAVAADLGGVTLWVTPHAEHPAFRELQRRHRLALAVQGAGDLGARMARACSGAGGPVLLIGTDAPAIDAAMLRSAAAALDEHAAVLVPAHDGGYALVGLRRPESRLLDALFAPMAWGSGEVMAATRRRLAAAGASWTELPPVHDVDVPADLLHVPPDWLDAAPGRACPLHYRYDPGVFAADAAAHCEVLYVVGGLYGNEPALQQVLEHYAQEAAPKRLVFNGDFHWFDCDAQLYARIGAAVLAHDALRGNVETELAAASGDAGCGCAYPESVSDAVVQHSNRILRRLGDVARTHPTLTRRQAQLPMWARVDVGALRVAIVHGDAQSLAGWGFAVEQLRRPAQRDVVRGWFRAARVDAFACSHTCLPVYATLPAEGGAFEPMVLNNGAAGMPNFSGDGAGLYTRIALRPWPGDPAARRLSLRQRDVHVDALAVDARRPAFVEAFARLWPAGSDAHASYGQRMAAGPAHLPALAQLHLD